MLSFCFIMDHDEKMSFSTVTSMGGNSTHEKPFEKGFILLITTNLVKMPNPFLVVFINFVLILSKQVAALQLFLSYSLPWCGHGLVELMSETRGPGQRLLLRQVPRTQ